jgi:membrane fusion protein, copper/silver efflux system
MQPSCGPPPSHGHEGHDAPASATVSQDQPDRHREPVTAPETFRRQLGGLIEANFALVGALSGDDPAAARQHAASAVAALQRIESEHLGEDDGRPRWAAFADTMQQALAALSGAEDLAGQRRHFESFSDALIEATQTFGVAAVGAVYRAMCPMVQGRRGYWLQADRTIANPYHGASMLRCGEVVEVIVEPDERGGGRP